MRWKRRQTVLHGTVEGSDRLVDLAQRACPICDSDFASIVLDLDELAFADSDGIEVLAGYCQEVADLGGTVLIRTSRGALRRLLLSQQLNASVSSGQGDGTGPGDPYTCPHRR